MTLKEQIANHNTTMYRLAKDSGVPYSTIIPHRKRQCRDSIQACKGSWNHG